jgi:L-seryl-tRNA(Ser) seleniumtransferase
MPLVQSLYRRLPAVHRLLDSPELADAVTSWGHDTVAGACRSAIDGLRHDVEEGTVAADELEAACRRLPERVLALLEQQDRDAYPAVVNATGVLIHTNLGRSPLPIGIPASLRGYLALEYDLEAGRRGQRLAPLRHRIARLCGAEDAVMVNNNAAALVLALATHARDREVIVSRSQLVEIGGSFRLPDVMEASGCHLKEVGCTNRTHLEDYERAIGPETAAILLAHQSNFRIVGFTTAPAVSEVAELAHRHRLPLLVDQGSGALHDLRRWGLAEETTVAELLAAGADIVCFSGDKLLGGPQAGVLVGGTDWIEPLGRHPLYRALRPDKTALVLMDHVLAAHQHGRLGAIPLYALLSASEEELARRARRLQRRLRDRGVPCRSQATRAALGGGTTPAETLPSRALVLGGGQRLADRLRAAAPPVVARIEDDEVVLDLRTVLPDQDPDLLDAVLAAYTAPENGSQDGGR